MGTTTRPADDGATPGLPGSLGQFDTNWIRSTVRSIRVESTATGSIGSRQVDEQRSLGVWNRFSDVPRVNDLRCYRFPPRRGSATTPEKNEPSNAIILVFPSTATNGQPPRFRPLANQHARIRHPSAATSTMKRIRHHGIVVVRLWKSSTLMLPPPGN